MEIWKSRCQVWGKQFCEINEAPQICSYFKQSVLIFSPATFFRIQNVANTTKSSTGGSNCNFMKYDFTSWWLECHYIYRMLDFQPLGGKKRQLCPSAAHYLLESEHAATNGCGDVYNSSNKTRRKTDPRSAPLAPLSINDCSGGGREWWMPADGVSLLSSVMEWEKSAFACGLSCGWLNSPVSPQSR